MLPEKQELYKTGEVLARSGISRQVLYRYMQMDLIRAAKTTDTGRNLFAGTVFKQIKLIQKDLASSVSFELWIKPAAGESARILDKVTPGKDDGLLIDTWPGLSIRTIIASETTTYKNVLKADVWQHVAVTIGDGMTVVYVDGKRL